MATKRISTQRTSPSKGAQPPLHLSSNLFVELNATNSPTLRNLQARFAAWERSTDNDGVLVQRDLFHAPPELAAVMKAVQSEDTWAPLSLKELEARLPAAATRLFGPKLKQGSNEELASLLSGLTEDTVRLLAEGYRREVSNGDVPGATFFLRRHVTLATVARLRAYAPSLFPPQDNRLLGAAEVMADERLLKTLSKQWLEEVIHGSVTASAFYGAHRVSQAAISRLRKHCPDLFPAVTHRHGIPDELDSKLKAREVGRLAKVGFTQDVFATNLDVLAKFNDDARAVERFGRVTTLQFWRLRNAFPEFFPATPTSDDRYETLHRELLALVHEGKANSLAEVMEELRQRHPHLHESWVALLRKRYGVEDVPSFGTSVRDPEQRLNDAKLISKTWLQSGATTVNAVIEIVGHERPDLKPLYVRSLLPEFPELFAEKGLTVVKEKRGPPSTFLNRAAWEAVLASAPPSAHVDDVLRVFHQTIGESSAQSRSEWNRFSQVTQAQWERDQKQRMSAVLAEYAHAAPEGMSEEEILERVRASYPLESLAPWKRSPRSFPALNDFISSDGQLTLVGKGKPPPHLSYVGGWSLTESLRGASAEERSRIESLAQMTRIPAHLPMLDWVVDKYGSPNALDNFSLLWVTHLKADTPAFAAALRSAGLFPGKVRVASSPYGVSPEVVETLRDEGYDVAIPDFSEQSYVDTVRHQLDSLLKSVPFPPNQAILVMDDGGLVAKLLHTEANYEQWLPYVRIVEQTTGGVTVAEDHPLKVPLLLAARTKTKDQEGPMVAGAVAQRLKWRLGITDWKGKNVAVVGGGVVGGAMAKRLDQLGAKVTIVENNPERAREIGKESGGRIAAASAKNALPNADVVLGATPKGTSLTLPLLRLLKDGATVASLSSRRREIDMDGLKAAASSLEVHPEPYVHALLPNVEFTLDGKKILVAADGWPVNHDAQSVGIPTAQFQLVDALLLASLLQIRKHGFKGTQGPVELDPEIDQALLDRFAVLQGEGEVSGDAPEEPDAFARSLERLWSASSARG